MLILKWIQHFKRLSFGRYALVIACTQWGLFFSGSAQAETRSIVDIGLFGDFYFVKENVNNGQAFGNIIFENTSDVDKIWVDVGAGGLLGKAGHSYIKASEFYYQRGREGAWRFYVGRWKNNWSFADSHWNLGFTQPQFLWDGARPEEQGLTGLFLDFVSKSDFRGTLFVSGTFLPTQGATFTLSNGSLVSSNPWFVPPVQALSFSDQTFRLNYEINTPSASQVIFRPGAGLKLSYGEKTSGWFANSFFFVKPRNELILPFEGTLNLTSFDGDVVVTPVVGTHSLGGGDIGLREDWGEFNFSWIYEGGITFDRPANSTFPEIPDQNIVSAALSFNLTEQHKIWVSYIQSFREATAVRGVYGNSNLNVFSYRNRFEKAGRIQWEGNFFHQDELPTLKTQLAWTQNFEDGASWVSGNLAWWISPSLESVVQCDFFGSQKDEFVGSDFLVRHQNNDRCLVGGHYAF